MNRITLVTDSGCDLHEDYIKENGIEILPLRVIYKDGEYEDRVTITPDEIYARLDKEIPTTSLPSPDTVNALFNRLRDRGVKKALFVLISSAMSGTYNLVRMMSRLHRDIETEVVDSKTLSMHLGFKVMEAVRLINEGVELGHFAEELEKIEDKSYAFFCVPQLDYLIKGGRIGLVTGTVGKILNIKPIIAVNKDGKYHTIAKTNGFAKAVQKLISILVEKTQGLRAEIALLHGNALEACKNLYEEIKALPNVVKLTIHQISPALAVHSGPGLLGIAYRVVGRMDAE